MRVLAITNLFPNARQPNRGVFNLQQFAALSRLCELRVVAPLPWRPWTQGLSRPAAYEEEWCGIPTLHPVHFHTPCVARAAYALWMHASLRASVSRLAPAYRPDVLLAAWAYPDAVATALLARHLRLPWIAEVLGSDINVLTHAPTLRPQIRWALRQAACTIAVSHPLKERLIELGIPAEQVRVLHNGVNVERFSLQDRAATRAVLGLPPDRRILLYVGNLETIKGVFDLIEAARLLAAPAAASTDVFVVLVGGGQLRNGLAEQIRRNGLSERVLLAGPQPHHEIPRWIAAADALCLPSHHEGCPNVVLEAMACGRPVVATRVGAVPDLIDEGVGRLAPPGEPARLAEAIAAVLSREWDARAIRERVLPLSWDANAANVMAALQAALGARHPAKAGGSSPADRSLPSDARQIG